MNTISPYSSLLTIYIYIYIYIWNVIHVHGMVYAMVQQTKEHSIWILY